MTVTTLAYVPALADDFPELRSRTLAVAGITPDVVLGDRLARFEDVARSRLAASPESGLPEIQAWRRAYTRMGLRPTDYRCASEQLLRRFRREGSLPHVHPLVDVCNAISLATAIPIAVFDVDRVVGNLTVGYAAGDERFLTFAGEEETPKPGEVIFADEARNAHARRWCNRQSGLSAVRRETARVLIVAEAMHATAEADVAALIATLHEELRSIWA